MLRARHLQFARDQEHKELQKDRRLRPHHLVDGFAPAAAEGEMYFPADLMRMWPISTRVNKPENDDPSIVQIELAPGAT